MSTSRPRHRRSSWRQRRRGSLKAALALTILALSCSYASIPAYATTQVTATATTLSTKGLLSLSLLSNGKPQTLSAPSGDAFFTLYVPTGTTPVEFVATMLIRGPVTGGIATITTPTNVYPETMTTVNGTSKLSVPLTTRDVQNGVVSIHVHIDLNLNSKYLNPNGCTSTNSIDAQIESANGLLSGALQSPTSPADFWPPQLNKVAVWVPSLNGLSSGNARAASLASMQVAATISQQYGTHTQVSIAQGSPPNQAISPLVRNVMIQVSTSSEPAQIAVTRTGTAPVLLITGQGNALIAEARAIGVGTLALATANNATRVKSSTSTTNPLKVTVTSNGTREITLAQLGTQTSIEGLGTVDVTQSLSQSQFGAPIRALQLRLRATYTPPPVGGVGTFSVLIGNYIVASQRLGLSGFLNMNASAPTSILSRTQTVEYRLDYSPPGGFCHAGLVPVQVTIDPSSGFAATTGQTLAPGFARSPQDVASGINVDVVRMNDQNLIDACQLVTSLSAILPYIPAVRLISNDQVLSGYTTELVVGATRGTTVALHAPIVLQPFRTLAANGISIGYTVNQPFAVLESFVQNGRDVILTGAYNSASLSHDLTRTINSPVFGGWFGLGTGQVAVMTPDHRLRLVGSSRVLSQLVPNNPASNLGIPNWLIVGIALIVLAIITRVIWLLLRAARLRHKAGQTKGVTLYRDEEFAEPGTTAVNSRIEVETTTPRGPPTTGTGSQASGQNVAQENHDTHSRRYSKKQRRKLT
ncbi:MAG: hypothetical protein ACYDEH_04165 [Acidimicrobiales bacterium]